MVSSIHTSELMNPCPRQALLRIEGKEHRTAETALVRGLVAHAALEGVSEEPELTTCSAVELAWDDTARKLIEEGRSISAAAVEGQEKIKAEVHAAVDKYREMVMPMVGTLVGCELPVSLSIDVDDKPVLFESHIDKVYIGADPITGEEALIVLDWKYHATAPSSPFLARNLQLGMYQYAVANGGVQVDGWPWVAPNLPLRCYWVHLPYLKPYGRKTTVTEDGQPVVYEKGDARPIRRVMFSATVTDWGKLLAGFAERVRMMRADVWPAIPEPTRCMLCQSNYACDAWGAYA